MIKNLSGPATGAPKPRAPANLHLRRWATPLTIGSFVLMTGTGIPMFFDLDTGLITVVHQWFSWTFLLGAGVHIAVNFRPFKLHLKSRWGMTSIAVFTVVLAASVFSWGLITGPQLERPIEEALVDAPLAALAASVRLGPETLLERLKARGFVATGEQSIRDIVATYDVDENILLALVFLPESTR